MVSLGLPLPTPLGTLRLVASGADAAKVALRLVPQAPSPHHSGQVDGCLAALWQLDAREATSPLEISCTWDHAPASGSPASGQYLDALTWGKEGVFVTVGTEDDEALSLRITTAPIQIRYTPDGLVVALPALPPGATCSGHFLIAWGPDELATWFAVDRPHQQVV